MKLMEIFSLYKIFLLIGEKFSNLGNHQLTHRSKINPMFSEFRISTLGELNGYFSEMMTS